MCGLKNARWRDDSWMSSVLPQTPPPVFLIQGGGEMWLETYPGRWRINQYRRNAGVPHNIRIKRFRRQAIIRLTHWKKSIEGFCKWRREMFLGRVFPVVLFLQVIEWP